MKIDIGDVKDRLNLLNTHLANKGDTKGLMLLSELLFVVMKFIMDAESKKGGQDG